MDSPPNLILASAVSPPERTVLSEIVQSGLDSTQVDAANPPNDDRIAHAYPVPEADHIEESAIEAGDYVLFYTGANQYTYAAEVLHVTYDNDVATAATNGALQQSNAADESFNQTIETLLWLDVPVPIELQSFKLHDILDLDNEALTKTCVCSSNRVSNLVDEYGSVEAMLISTRAEPSVYAEVASPEKHSYKQPGGKFELGTAVFSRSRDINGTDVFGSMTEPQLGDFVLHFLEDSRELRGISMVTSPSQTGFEGPPDGSWEASARGDGYFLNLANYTTFEDAVHLDDDLLQNSDYRGKLEQIYDNFDALFYDGKFGLNQYARLTAVPTPLLYILLAEEHGIVNQAKEWLWAIDPPKPVDSYDTVSGAVVDIRTRLPFSQYNNEWFQEVMTQSLVERFTESLKSVQPDEKVSPREAAHCELIASIYTDNASRFDETANKLGAGKINQVSPGKSLFFVLFRELQSALGLSANMNYVKVVTILEEKYTVETPRRETPVAEKRGPLDPREAPARSQEIARQLREVKQMVFYGPPGTGKTYTAKQFAHWWLNNQSGVDPDVGQLETVTFHPSFSYEDFVEGLSVDSDGDTVTYDEEPGVFLEFAERARQAYYVAGEDEAPDRHVLIVDEINRGNLSQIFGELITALEADKREGQDNETMISLSHSGEQFSIPPNLYIIGTMNTADRSIALVDAALRRRFRFLSFPPNLDVVRDEYGYDSRKAVISDTTGTGDVMLRARTMVAVEKINTKIRAVPDLGRGKQIGHSFLLGLDNTADIVDTWRFEILPLLEEYFFGQYPRIRERIFEDGGDELFDWDRQQIRAFDKDDLETALGSLIDEFDPDELGATQ